MTTTLKAASRPSTPLAFFDDQHPSAADFRRDVLDGLSAPQKYLSPIYFYDAEGSALFDAITELPEYYPTRTELSILDTIGNELAERAGSGAVIVEPGSGSSIKIRKLIDALDTPAAYVGLDISGEHLQQACTVLAEDYPGLSIGAICADFTTGLDLDGYDLPHGRRLVFFPGSTIGNFEIQDAIDLLKGFRAGMRDDDAILIGVDRVKDEQTLVDAYDDSQGVSAAFNLNLVTRINRELEGTIDAGKLRHLALWNEKASRIEMHLQAVDDIEFSIAGETFAMKSGETIHTENSHKFTPDAFSTLAARAGFTVRTHWSDERELFTLYWLEPDSKA